LDNSGQYYSSAVVVEYLTFDLSGLDVQRWLEVEDQVWGEELRTRPGFINKQIWESKPNVVHAVIWWRDQESWNAIGADEVAAIDARMGEWFREPTMTEFRVVNDNGIIHSDTPR